MASYTYNKFKEENNLGYTITHDLGGAIRVINNCEDPDTIQKIYDDISQYIKENSANLNYFTHGRVLLHCLGNNPHTPPDVIYEVMHGITAFRDKELGIEPDVFKLFKKHRHAGTVKGMKAPKTTYHNGSQEMFNRAYQEEENARVFFRDNPEAQKKMRNTPVEYPIGRNVYARSQRFDPEHVKKTRYSLCDQVLH